MDPTKCGAIKKDKKQCTNKIKKDGACGIDSHILQMRKKLGLYKPDDKGYVPLRITKLDPGAANPESVVKEIETRLKEGPSESDKHGYLYMYFIKDGDASMMYRKVGRTERLPEKRMEEWPSGTLIKSWACKRNRMAEYLVHKYLDYARVERLAMDIDSAGKKTYLSVWWSNGEFVADKNYIKYYPLLGEDESKQLDVAHQKAKKRDIEWFKEDQQTIMEIIRIVVGAINQHYRHEPWADWMPEAQK